MQPEAIFRSLAEHGVEYVLVGGLAATAHGASLVTLDTDICFRQTPANCERLAEALGSLGAEIFPTRPILIPITGELLQTHRIVHLRTQAGRLDVMAEVPGLGNYAAISPGVAIISVGDLQVPILSLDQLIQAKSVLSQPKDREHLDQLLAIRKLRNEVP
jgi:hypothetical protein